MYCPNCNKQNPDGAAFCASCGKRLSFSGDGAESASPQQAYKYGAYSRNEGASVSGAVLRTVRSLITSKMFLAVAILLSLSFVFTMISKTSATNESMMESLMDGIIKRLEDAGLDIDANLIHYSIISTVTASFGTVLTGLLPLIGFWLLYAAANNRNSEWIKPGGMVLLRVLALLELIFTCIVGGFLALSAITLIGLNTYGQPLMLAFVLPIVIICLGVMAFMIIYLAKLYRTVKSIEISIKTGFYDGRASKFAAVVMIIFGGLAILSSISNVSSMILLAVDASATVFLVLLPLLGGVLGGLANILAGTLLLQYKNRMTEMSAAVR